MGERRIWWHLVNDNRHKNGRKGTPLKSGRFFLHLWDLQLSWEWRFGKLSCYFHVNTGDESDIHVGIAVPLVILWFKAKRFGWYRWLPDEPRTTGFAIHDWAIWFDIWQRQNEWAPKRDRFTHFNFNIRDFCLGSATYSQRTLRTERVIVPMPERDYPATVEVFESTWTRRRWPWPTRIMRCDITPDIPIPFPGKGENSWDQGEDATHSLTTPADTAQQAVATLVESVMRRRSQYGGANWQPAGTTSA